MKLRDSIKNIFDKEYQKEAAHISALERKILSHVQEESSSSPFALVQRVPSVFVAILLFLIIGTATVAATENPIKDTIKQITERLQQAVDEALQTGETTIDERGQKVFTGETAEEMERLHEEAQQQIKELKARPEKERQKTIEFLQTWIETYLYTAPDMPRQDDIAYGGVVGLNDDPTHKIEIYYSHDYEYQIDPETNKIYDVSIRGSRAKDDKEVTYMDHTPRYNQLELEHMARAFITHQLPDVDLSGLTLERGAKGTNYFFKWIGDEEMKKPTKDAKGYQVCGDVANPDSYDENGTPCVTYYESMTVPSIQVGFTQGGQLLGYTSSGF